MHATVSVLLLAMASASPAAEAVEADELFQFTPSPETPVRVDVDARRRAARPLSRLLYGKFTEHLGRNIYQGMWAQLLWNPGFEPAEFWGRRADRIGEELAYRLETPELAEAARRGAPPGWALGSGEAAACRPDPEARTGRQCVRLYVARPGASARVWQPVFLPRRRQRGWEWSLVARADRDATLTVRLALPAAAGRRAEQTVRVAAGSWRRLQGRLRLDPPDDSPLAPGRWEIELNRPGAVRIDQCFLFPGDHLDGWDPDIVRMVKDSRLPLLRWPGGNFASGYHWKDGVGPVDDRPVRLNRPWNMPEPNHVGTDEFMRFCELTGAEPMICVNAGEGTADEAADWVEYCNGPADSPMGKLRAANGHPEPYGVRYWEIGNELYGRWQLGHCTAEAYADRYRRFVAAMRRRDPSIRFIANGHDLRWNQVLADQCAEILRRVSVHTLIGGGISPDSDPEAVWRLVVGFPWAYRGQLAALSDQLRRRVPQGTLAITELQIFTNRPNLPNNGGLAEALFWAGVVHAAARMGDRVELITHSALVNHGGGLRKAKQVVWGTPVYWARRMYSTQAGRWPLPVRLEGPAYDAPRLHNLPALREAPAVDVLALLDDSGRQLCLLAINRDPRRALPMRARLRGFRPERLRWRWLTGPHILAANTLEAPETVRIRERGLSPHGELVELTLPPRSVSVVEATAAQTIRGR